MNNYTPDLVSDLTATGTDLLDITTYDFDGTDYYDDLISNLNVKTVFFSNYNINNLITNYTLSNIDAAFLDYLKTLEVIGSKTNTYRIIVIMKNGSYANTYFSTDDIT
jgi:hypothetical protein